MVVTNNCSLASNLLNSQIDWDGDYQKKQNLVIINAEWLTELGGLFMTFGITFITLRNPDFSTF